MARDKDTINAGECRVATVFENNTETIDGEGYITRTWKNVFGEGKSVPCKWEITNYGAWEAKAAGESTTDRRTTIQKKARIVCRKTPLITPTCRARRRSSMEWWDVKTVEELHEGWIAIVATREEATQ